MGDRIKGFTAERLKLLQDICSAIKSEKYDVEIQHDDVIPHMIITEKEKMGLTWFTVNRQIFRAVSPMTLERGIYRDVEVDGIRIKEWLGFEQIQYGSPKDLVYSR